MKMPIKILFFIEDIGGGGAQKVLLDLVNRMDPTKFEITVQSLWPSEERKKINPGIHYRSIFASRTTLTKKLYRIEAALNWIYALHIKDDYDIEVAFLEMGTTKIMSGSSNQRAVKLAWVHCDLQMAVDNKEHFTAKCRSWYRNFDRVVCVSQTAKESFDRLFEGEFSSTVLHNYVDVQTIHTLAAKSMLIKKSDDRITLLAVGSIYPPKNYPRLILACKKLLDSGHKIELWIVGDGAERQHMEAYVSDNRMENAIRFWGYQENPYPFFSLADVLVCSSNYEGYSTVITEGLLLGKVIVTTDCSGMQELLGNSEYGLITRNNDESFYKGLVQIVEDTELRDHYARQASMRGAQLAKELSVNGIEEFFIECFNEKNDNAASIR